MSIVVCKNETKLSGDCTQLQSDPSCVLVPGSCDYIVTDGRNGICRELICLAIQKMEEAKEGFIRWIPPSNTPSVDDEAGDSSPYLKAVLGLCAFLTALALLMLVVVVIERGCHFDLTAAFRGFVARIRARLPARQEAADVEAPPTSTPQANEVVPSIVGELVAAATGQ